MTLCLYKRTDSFQTYNHFSLREHPLSGLAVKVALILILTQIISACSGERYTALMNAARNGDTDAVREMLDLDTTQVDEKTSKGKTALMLAAAGGFVDTVKLLLDRGADVTLQDNYGTTALIVAATSGHAEIARILAERGGDPLLKDSSGGSALGNATFFGHTETVIELLDTISELNKPDGEELLMLAAGLGLEDIATHLLKKGVSPDARGVKQRTALMAAVAFEKTNMVKLLLEHSADPLLKDDDGLSALMVAKNKNNENILSMLKKK